MIKNIFFIGAFVFLTQFAFSSVIPELIKSSGSSTDYPNSDLLIIFDSTDVDMLETGLSYYYTHTLSKILTTKGARDFSIFKYGTIPFRLMSI